jgi:hypothetical protein
MGIGPGEGASHALHHLEFIKKKKETKVKRLEIYQILIPRKKPA